MRTGRTLKEALTGEEVKSLRNDMTEGEAHRKDCLMTMAEEQGTACMGSRCMGWRWSEQDGDEPRGYCGVAGRL